MIYFKIYHIILFYLRIGSNYIRSIIIDLIELRIGYYILLKYFLF